MMTLPEAIARARHIWGSNDVQVVLGARNGAEVLVQGKPHSLDAEGHATCHTKCVALEDAFDGARDRSRIATLEQLLREAVAILGQDAALDIKDWLRSAKDALGQS